MDVSVKSLVRYGSIVDCLCTRVCSIFPFASRSALDLLSAATVCVKSGLLVPASRPACLPTNLASVL